MANIIRVGDRLKEHGGQVISGSYNAFGKPIACVGDRAICNKHGSTRIAQGSSKSTINGKGIALHGCRCECGCSLVSSLTSIDIES